MLEPMVGGYPYASYGNPDLLAKKPRGLCQPPAELPHVPRGLIQPGRRLRTRRAEDQPAAAPTGAALRRLRTHCGGVIWAPPASGLGATPRSAPNGRDATGSGAKGRPVSGGHGGLLGLTGRLRSRIYIGSVACETQDNLLSQRGLGQSVPGMGGMYVMFAVFPAMAALVRDHARAREHPARLGTGA